MISIVTPWSGDTASLLPDYANATRGAQVVIVDNGTPEETSTHLAGVTEVAGNVYIRNESNAGFAAGNNQGYARAEGDVIIFLNSDVAGDPSWLQLVADDVKDGALYGPSLQSQFVAGRWLPYLEGWCIAATRGTWERLTTPTEGPWDAYSYPGPYWEDNDLCFRAVQAGLSLIQTQWPIQHKGGRSAGTLAKHAASIEKNRATFSGRVMGALDTSSPNTPTHARYLQACATQSDIQHHLPLLFSLARGNVVELGTRGGVSTMALLAGVEAHGGRVWSIDVEDCSQVAAGHPKWVFYQGDSRDVEAFRRRMMEYNPDIFPSPVDLLLIDTQHEYEVAQAELAAWHPYMAPASYICMHDPVTFPGVGRAAREFAQAHGWELTMVLPNNGMAVLRNIICVSTEGASWAMEAIK